MLETVAKTVREKYYDPSFHGVDIEARFSDADKKIRAASSIGQAVTAIAAALDYLEDSHTFFLPPPRSTRYSYGWQMQMIGDRCLVTEVKPDSDAEAKGLAPGDEILAIRSYSPTRQALPKLHYYFESLRPQPSLALRVRTPSGEERALEISARITQFQRIMGVTLSDYLQPEREAEEIDKSLRARYVSLGEGAIVVRVPTFNLDAEETDNLLSRVRKSKKVILDLRGNHGGLEKCLLRMIEGMFPGDVSIGMRIGRKETKPLIARGLGNRAYSGELIVLVDGESASAAEIFARVVQIEKRGRVLGDLTSGRVMRSRIFQSKVGVDTVTFFGASITESDLVMKDGQSLEGRGVTPDELLLPAPKDLRTRRDPVLARACALLGFPVSPEAAGRWFPYQWIPD